MLVKKKNETNICGALRNIQISATQLREVLTIYSQQRNTHNENCTHFLDSNYMASLSPLLGGQSTTTSSSRHRHHHYRHQDIHSWRLKLRQSCQRLPENGERGSFVRVFAATESPGKNPNQRERPPPGVDTRIHWDNEDEGWVGGGSKTTPSTYQEAKEQFNKAEDERTKEILGDKFSELLINSTDSHYQFLGISPDADLDEIKSAFRRLSKEYHPDTTSLPLKAASDMFMKLRDVYDTLSDDEKRKFYDWTLAQEVASREAEKMSMNIKDPYMQEVENFVSVPDMVDRLGGRNMELSDQAKSALTFDIAVIIFSIICIIFAVLNQEP